MSHKIKILYVDDYELDRDLVRDVLEREHGGFEVMEASCKEEFQALLEQHKFDVVLSDFNIAGFNGLQVIEAVRAMDPQLPVIIVTGTGSEEIVVKALKKGASDYVIKRPHHIQKLPQTILSTIEKQRLIAEQKEYERNIEKQSVFLKTLLNTIPNPIFYKNTEGEYVLVNSAFEEFYGKQKDEIIGKTVFDLAPSQIAEKYYEKDNELFQHPGKQTYQWTVINASGEQRDVIFNKASCKNPDGMVTGLIGVIYDITERIKSEITLKENQMKFQDLYDNAPDMYVSVDAKTSLIIECNQTLADNLGYTKEDIIGLPVFDLYHPDSLNAAKTEFQNFVSTGFINNAELQLKRKNGTKIDVILNVTAVRDEKGNILYSRSAWRDISSYKKMEKEKERLESQLQQAQKLESIGNLAGGIAHDFNNILTVIIGFTELALNDVEKGSLLEDRLQEVFTAGKRARDLVKQILAFARQSDEKVEPIEVRLIAREALKFIRSSIPTTIEIKQNIESDSLIMGNSTQLYQIFMNLCTNAAYAMDDKGGTLEVSLSEITIDSNKVAEKMGIKLGDYIEIKVADTGSGIPPEFMEMIYEPYFTSKPQGEGTGMGLAMVHGIVESCGGRIFVNSTPGKGTVFRVILPITHELQEQHQYESEILPIGTEKILFIDDESSIIKMGSQLLRQLGYTVSTHINSADALEVFEDNPYEFDLVITDMTMPNMTGDVVAIELIKLRQDIPVILFTGYSDKISDEIASRIGIKAFCYKPIEKFDLAKTVREVLDEAKASD